MVMVMVSLGNTVAFVPMYQPKFSNDVSLVRQGFMLQIWDLFTTKQNL